MRLECSAVKTSMIVRMACRREASQQHHLAKYAISCDFRTPSGSAATGLQGGDGKGEIGFLLSRASKCLIAQSASFLPSVPLTFIESRGRACGRESAKLEQFEPQFPLYCST
jgi:hypothetical protein